MNSGVARAAKVLQRLLALADDGRMTGDVIAAVREREVADLVRRICDERLAFLKQLKTWPVFGAGWGRRVAEVRATALRMAASPAVAPQSKLPASRGKDVVPVSGNARKGIAAAVVAAGAALAQQAHQAGLHAALAAAIGLGIAAAAIAGWFVWRRRRVAD